MSGFQVTPEEWAKLKMQADDLKVCCVAQGWKPAVMMLAIARHLRASPVRDGTISILMEIIMNGEQAFEEQYELVPRKQ